MTLRGAVSAVSALALAIVPVAVQAAPQPAPRTAAVTEDAENLSTTGWIVAGIGLVLLVWGIIELTDDDEPDSP
jgi:hypothetical protein